MKNIQTLLELNKFSLGVDLSGSILGILMMFSSAKPHYLKETIFHHCPNKRYAAAFYICFFLKQQHPPIDKAKREPLLKKATLR